jgi:hypothetical protein
MFAENRRAERREDILDMLEEHGFVMNEIMDYTSAEEDGFYLELPSNFGFQHYR